jgi:hypothetical protein
MDKQEWTIAPPMMSWDIPIEQEILQFVRQMAGNMETQASHSIWGSNRKGAQAYANAYRTVEKHILKEIGFRGRVAEARLKKEVSDEYS